MTHDLWRSTPVVPKPGALRNRLGRRAFIGGGAVLASSFALGVRHGNTEDAPAPPADPPWSQSLGAGVVDQPYGQPASSQSGVIRRNVPWLTAGTQSSVSFSPLQDLHGIITPNGLFFERHHAGRPDVDPALHRLLIHGLVERPLLSCAEWTGVKLSTLLEEVGVNKECAAGQRGLRRAMRGLPRHLRRGRGPLSETGRRRRNTDERPARTDGRQLLAVRPDAVGLH